MLAGRWIICSHMICMGVSSLASSAFHLVCITALHYMSVRWPLKYKQIVSGRRMFMAILLSWLMGIAYGVGFYARPKPGMYVYIWIHIYSTIYI